VNPNFVIFCYRYLNGFNNDFCAKGMHVYLFIYLYLFHNKPCNMAVNMTVEHDEQG